MKKNKRTTIEGFKAVGFMRKTRDKISKEIANMSFEEIKQYFENRRKKLATTANHGQQPVSGHLEK